MGIRRRLVVLALATTVAVVAPVFGRPSGGAVGSRSTSPAAGPARPGGSG